MTNMTVREEKVGKEVAESKKTRSQRIAAFLSLTHKDASPIEWEILLLILFAIFTSCYSITFVFPFLPDMILYFGYPEEDKGYYSGIIASGIFAGRIVSSYFWGWLSDRRGRKPVLLACMLLTSASNVLVGFCPSVAATTAVRVLNGLVNGIVVVGKTVLYEISDNTNQAVHMAVIGLAWGSGIILGPLISGYLAFPAKRYPAVFAEEGVFGRWPFLLPSLVASLSGIIFVPIIILRLPETRHRRRDAAAALVMEVTVDDEEKESLAKNPQDKLTKITKSPAIALKQQHQQQAAIYSSLDDLTSYSPPNPHFLDDKDERGREGEGPKGAGLKVAGLNEAGPKGAGQGGGDPSAPCQMPLVLHMTDDAEESKEPEVEVASSDSCWAKMKKSKLFKIIRMKDVRDSVAIYSIISFGAIGWDECFTVFSSTDPSLGGLGFRPDQIGTALGLSSTPLIVIQVFLFPAIEKRIGAKKAFEFFCLILIFISSTMICLRALLDEPTALWGLLLSMMGMMKIAQVTCFTATSLFINNSATPDLTGSVNGLSMTVTAILRTLAPTVGGALFSWSIVSGYGFPLDVNLVFLLFSAVYTLANITCAQMSPRLDKQKKMEDKEEEVES